MKELRLKDPVAAMSDLFRVSRSGFYCWLNREPSLREAEEQRFITEIQAAHWRTRETYGAARLQYELSDQGITVGVHRNMRIRRKQGIRCKQKKRYKATTNSRHNLPVADNFLDQQFTVDCPNAVWLTDLTYIATDEGWLYLGGHKDMFTGEIVGYALAEMMTKSFACSSKT